MREFENDVHLMFHNYFFIYNDVKSKIYYLDKVLECIFNKKWIKQPISQTKHKEKLRKKDYNDDIINSIGK
jgi:hypothetical protein